MKSDDLFTDNGQPLPYSLHDFFEIYINDSKTSQDIIAQYLIYKALDLEKPITNHFTYLNKLVYISEQNPNLSFRTENRYPDIYIFPIYSDLTSIPLDISKWLFILIAEKDIPNTRSCSIKTIISKGAKICPFDSLQSVLSTFCKSL